MKIASAAAESRVWSPCFLEVFNTQSTSGQHYEFVSLLGRGMPSLLESGRQARIAASVAAAATETKPTGRAVSESNSSPHTRHPFRPGCLRRRGPAPRRDGWLVWPAVRTLLGRREKTSATSQGLRDVYASSPYQNARPGVAYVGDAACVQCHREISEAYRSHPMGRSLKRRDRYQERPAEPAPPDCRSKPKGCAYTIGHRDGRVFHQATRRDGAGASLAEIEGEVRFALGSGSRGIAYLIERDGYLSSRRSRGTHESSTGYLPRLRRVHHAAELRAADPA